MRTGGTLAQSKPLSGATYEASGAAGLASSSTTVMVVAGALTSVPAVFAGTPFVPCTVASGSSGTINSAGGSAQLTPAEKVQATSPNTAQRDRLRRLIMIFASLRGKLLRVRPRPTRWKARKPKRLRAIRAWNRRRYRIDSAG